ncbi:hypothetical protein BXY58_1594 [Epilithonimonas arachidiradicis]|uniref:Uncharacterized protein n=1 Tax=Epilithonimonas arachidiradicis TaxID=1617282 RepID=A0A420D8Y4_9FLAO|nr:hypothetical protein BXY58_1594 [Epilithonimonas arachidiradicis]
MSLNSNFINRKHLEVMENSLKINSNGSELNQRKEKRYKPDSVKACYLSKFYITTKLELLTPHQRTGRPLLMIYLALHRIEFTWFHYSRTVHTFCCTCPILSNDGCYPLCCPTVSGLSYPN